MLWTHWQDKLEDESLGVRISILTLHCMLLVEGSCQEEEEEIQDIQEGI